jgi:histidine triad (HIT) family protein
MTKSGCSFCKIVRGESPAYIVFEDDLVVAFMDALPMTDGHCLVIPKGHCDDILAVDAAQSAALIAGVQRIGKAQQSALGAAGFNLICNTGAAADQTQFHVHFHVVPRYGNDRLLHPSERRFGHWPTIAGIAQRLQNAPEMQSF